MSKRRLPGFRFEAQPPTMCEILPRMDIAVFVGFAASGPLHVPVAVDHLAQFTEIFGDDAPLVWDCEAGKTVYAYLAPAVRAFFRNGGRRCWIVRVAREAQSNVFPISGLAKFAADKISPAFTPARSAGSWSDTLRVSAALLRRTVEVANTSLESLRVTNAPRLLLTHRAKNEIVLGDLLRLTFREQGDVAIFVVKSLVSVANSSLRSPESIEVVGAEILWFKQSWFKLPATKIAQIIAFTHAGENAAIPAVVAMREQPVSEAGSPPEPLMDWSASENDALIKLDAQISLMQAPAPGSIVRVDFGAEQLWLMVQVVSATTTLASPMEEQVRISGIGLWHMPAPPAEPFTSLPIGERLSFEIWVRQADAHPVRMSELAFAKEHARFWGALPKDEQLYENPSAFFQNNYQKKADASIQTVRENFGVELAHPRFPLAGNDSGAAFFFPLAMAFVPEHYLGPESLPNAPTTLERDGLAEFDARVFLDPDLIEANATALMEQADFLRYHSPQPRALKGIHAALEIEEATIIAVPDALHRGWEKNKAENPPPATFDPRLARPEWWHFLDCAKQYKTPLAEKPFREHFLNCDLRKIDMPHMRYIEKDSAVAGNFPLTWTGPLESGVEYILQEATRPNFSDAVTIYVGSEQRFLMYGRSTSDYYYRVRAVIGEATSDWSNGVAVRVVHAAAWEARASADYSAHSLLAVQRALLRLCAGRGDLFAVLSLPEHYRKDEALAHLALLKSPFGPIARTAPETAPEFEQKFSTPIGAGETRAFSFGAVYHPWLIGREEHVANELRRTPPEGAICGLFAKRALGRGAWIAPANEPLRGVVALHPAIDREHWLDLQEAQLNLIRQEPNGFLVLNADTLSDDPDLRLINVRRLLMLLRRLALRHGPAYVFEPNDEALQRLVQRGFETWLDQMFARGAFAGATPQTSYQVVTSRALNTPPSVEQGRFIVELRVAPSLPMRFLTLRLVQSGDRALVTENF